MIPKILYHGTSLIRFIMGIDQAGLIGNMPRQLQVDNDHMGYVFLSEKIPDAAFYGLVTMEMDRLNPPKIAGGGMTEIPLSHKAVVLAVQTKAIRKEIEEDPEYWDVRRAYEKAGTWDIAHEMMMRGKWYRYFGDIPKKHIFPLKDAPMDKQPEWMQKIYKGIAKEKIEEEIGIRPPSPEYQKTPHPHQEKK